MTISSCLKSVSLEIDSIGFLVSSVFSSLNSILTQDSFQESVLASLIATLIWVILLFLISSTFGQIKEVPLVSIISEYIDRLFVRRRETLTVGGIWCNYQEKNSEKISNYMKIRQFGNYITAKTIPIKDIHNDIYSMRAKNNNNFKIKSYIVGEWEKLNHESPGAFELQIINNNKLEGAWIQPNTDIDSPDYGSVESGTWRAKRVNHLPKSRIERFSIFFHTGNFNCLNPSLKFYELTIETKTDGKWL